MNENNKKVIISLVVGITTFVLLIMGATFAYYQATNSASGSTTVDVTAEAAGNVMVTNPTENLYISLAEYEMQQSNTGTSYYATDRYNEGKTYAKAEQNHVLGKYAISEGEEDDVYNCTFNVNITKPEGIKSGDMTLILNGATTQSVDLYSANSTYQASFTVIGNGTGTILTGDIKFNNTESEQSYLVDKILTTNISISNLECGLSENKSICTLASDSEVAAGEYGAKYNCKVDPVKPEHTFYLIDNNEDGTSDLIMNANINAEGEEIYLNDRYVDTTIWYKAGVEDDNRYGPITATDFLHNATKSWINVNPLNYEYYDRQALGITKNSGYQSFISTNGIVIITGYNSSSISQIGTIEEPVRTRMANITEIKSYAEAPFFYENLLDEMDWFKSNGYWTLSSSNVGDYRMVMVLTKKYGNNTDLLANHSSYYGVRPVINVKL